MTPSEYLDNRIEYWHNHDTEDTLLEFLKLTNDEYERWVMGGVCDSEIGIIVMGRTAVKD